MGIILTAIIYFSVVGWIIYAFWKKRQNKKVAAEAASAEKTKVKRWVYWAVGLVVLMLLGLFNTAGTDPCDCVDTFGSYSLNIPSKGKASLGACERKYGLVNGSGPSRAMEACGNKSQY